jgi:hypothetical protein
VTYIFISPFLTTAGTTEVSSYRCKTKSAENVHLVDTPGFDDTSIDIVDVLRDLSFTLIKLHGDELKLNGILYLHPVSMGRLDIHHSRTQRMFGRLCGEKPFGRVALVLTMCETIEAGAVDRKENRLRTADWGAMMDDGSTVFKHYNTEGSALAIIEGLAARSILEEPT